MRCLLAPQRGLVATEATCFHNLYYNLNSITAYGNHRLVRVA